MGTYDLERLELVRSDLGDGGWSIHVRRTDVDERTDPQRAWPIVLDDEAEPAEDGGWTRPDAEDWAEARRRAEVLADEGRRRKTKSGVKLSKSRRPRRGSRRRLDLRRDPARGERISVRTGDVVTHSVFGAGRVVRVPSRRTAVVRFLDGLVVTVPQRALVVIRRA